MRIERYLHGRWIIARGTKRNETYFCLFVDDSKVCWTKNAARMQTFTTKESAGDTLAEIYRRAAALRATKETT